MRWWTLALGLTLTSAAVGQTAPPPPIHRFWHSLKAWNTVALPLVTDVISQLVTRPRGFSDSPRGYAHHYAVNLADDADSKFLIHFAFPVAFHQDERYQPLGPAQPWQARVHHVLDHLLWTQSADQSHTVFNTTGIPAAASGVLLGNFYQPRPQRTVRSNLEGIGWNVAGYIGGDLYSEFLPEINQAWDHRP